MELSRQNNQPSNIVPSIPTIVIFLAIIMGGAIIVTLFAPVLLPPQASVQAQRTDSLFTILLLLGGIVFFLVEGLLVYSIFRFRARPNDVTDGPSIHGNTTLEIVWTIIPSITVVILAILSFVVWQANSAPQDDVNLVEGQPMQVKVIGARYAWSFEYVTPQERPLAEGETLAEGEETPRVAFTTNQLHTYVGQHVKLDMNTRDVIHSFWIPAMRLKQDVMPGKTTEIRFDPIVTNNGFEYRLDAEGNEIRLTPDEARLSREDAAAAGLDNRYTKYRIVCSELCGSGHGQMYAELFVHEDEAAFLANFYEAQVFAALNPPDDPVLKGQAILSSGAYPCANCHILESMGWAGVTGPSLNGIGDRAGRRVGGLSGIEYLAQSIHLPNEYLVAGYAAGQMPHFGHSEEAPEGQNPYNVMPESDLIGIIGYLCSQVESGNLNDNTCGLAFGDDGALADSEATLAQIEAVTATYRSLYE